MCLGQVLFIFSVNIISLVELEFAFGLIIYDLSAANLKWINAVKTISNLMEEELIAKKNDWKKKKREVDLKI